MPNHYHVLVETVDPTLSMGMRQLNGIYTQRFNKANDRVGHLFQGRFKAILVDEDNYLLELIRYIVLNPVRANMVGSPERWGWSSHRNTLDGNNSQIVLTDWALAQFAQAKSIAKKKYKEFVARGLNKKNPLEDVKGGVVLGGKEFIEKIQEHLNKKDNFKEIPSRERYLNRPSLKCIFSGFKGLKDRNAKIYLAHQKHGYTLTEIGVHLGLHYSVISRAFKKINDARNNT